MFVPDTFTMTAMSFYYRDTLFNFGCGLSCHVLFNRFEPRQPVVHFALLVAIPAILAFTQRSPVVAYIQYLSALVTSLVVYRLSPFHPLAKYPGPWICRLTKLPMAIHAFNGTLHFYIYDQHQKYGMVVRLGPNQLSFTDPAAIHDMMGAKGLRKGTAWHGMSPGLAGSSLINMFDKAEHARRRKVWNRGFKAEALKEYEPIVAARADQLVRSLEQSQNPANMSQYFDYFSFDFMSDMAFGGGSEMLRDGDTESILKTMILSNPGRVLGGQLPWLSPYMVVYNNLFPSTLIQFRNLVYHSVMRRLKEGSSRKDLFYYLSDEGGFEPVKPTVREVLSDGGLAMVAGSDTTSTVLTHIFFFLATDEGAYRRLQNEIDETQTAGDGVFDASKLAHLPYLNAVVNEALRLFPAVPSGSPREPHRGVDGDVLLGPYHVPEGTAVQMHFYSMQRDERYFSPFPNTFMPDRWLVESERSADCPKIERHNQNAFIPFSHGPAVCVGKSLALAEMRLVTAMIVKKFEFRLADDFSAQSYPDGIRDFFVTQRGPLPLILKVRKH